jgi:hypothetical protein
MGESSSGTETSEHVAFLLSFFFVQSSRED